MKIKKDTKKVKTSKINNIEAISRTTNKNSIHNGFPQPKKVLCSNCKETEFFVKFVIAQQN